MWAWKALFPAPEKPIVANGQTTKGFVLRSKRRWSDSISDARKTSMTSNFLPPTAPTRTGDAILQHFRKVRKDCIKVFALIHRVKEAKPTWEQGRVNFEHIARGLWNTKGEDNEGLRCQAERIGEYRQRAQGEVPRFMFMYAYKCLET
jgi:hypothetical protein